MTALVIRHIPRSDARAAAAAWHSHHEAHVGDIICLGAFVATLLVAVEVLGRPVAPALDDGATWEITRQAVGPDAPAFTASRLHGRAQRLALAAGMTRVVTYTRFDERGSSLLASNFYPVAMSKGEPHTHGNRALRWLPGLYEPSTEIVERVRWEASSRARAVGGELSSACGGRRALERARVERRTLDGAVVSARILVGDCRARMLDLEPGSVQTCITSPPYWGLRDYGVAGQLGLEATPEEFVANLVDVFRGVRRVLRDDGTLWLNLGDTYMGGRSGGMGEIGITSGRNHEAARAAWVAQGGRKHRVADGLKPKDLVGIPWSVALALRADGWYLRSDVIWSKPNPMPESVSDRPTKAHEYVFLLSKNEQYFWDQDAIREPQKTLHERHKGRSGYRDGHPSKGGISERKLHALGANKRTVWEIEEDEYEQFIAWKAARSAGRLHDVWNVATHPLDCERYGVEHFATFPRDLIRPCILSSSRPGDVVLDCFHGMGTVGVEACALRREYVGTELSQVYADGSVLRIVEDQPLFADVTIDSGFVVGGAA